MEPKIELMFTITALFIPIEDLFFPEAVLSNGNNACKYELI